MSNMVLQMGRHAKLSPSGWKQWSACPGSIGLISSLKIHNKTSKYAAEGSAAHEIHELCLLTGNNADEYIGEKITVDGMSFKVTKDMCEAVQTSLDYIRKRIFEAKANDMRVEMIIEKWVSLKHLNIKGLDGGTADVILIFIDDWDGSISEIEVVDYKHGAGVSVDPVNNGQAIIYAIGATAIDQLKGYEVDVTITITQPRCFNPDGPIRSWFVDHNELIKWKKDVVSKAKATLDPNAPLIPSTDGCRFCDAKANCSALYNLANDSAMLDFSENKRKQVGLSVEQKLKIIKNKALIISFFDAVWSNIFDEIVSGSKEYIDYLKVVKSKTNRKLTEEWANEIEFYLDEDEMYNQKPKGIGELEKNLDKAVGAHERIELMKIVTFKPEGGLTMVTSDDPRESALTTAQDEDWS